MLPASFKEAPMSYILELLSEIRTRSLAIYVGETSLTRLADFLRGYEHAVYRLRPGEPDSLLAEFREWIYRRFKNTENITWEALIVRHSVNEAEAVKRFWLLLDEYLLQKQDRERT